MGAKAGKQEQNLAKVQVNKDQAVRGDLPRQETKENNPPPTNSGSVIDQKREDVSDSPLQITKNNETPINAVSELGEISNKQEQEIGEVKSIQTNPVSESDEISTKEEQEIAKEKTIHTNPELTEEELNGSASTSSFQEYSSSKRTGNKQGDKKDGPSKSSENEQPDGGYATSNEKKNESRNITPHPSTVQPAAKPKEKTDEISPAERGNIAEKIAHKWKFVAMQLENISDEDTNIIAYSNFGEDASEKANRMLQRYLERNGTRQELVNALRAVKLLKVADQVEQKTL